MQQLPRRQLLDTLSGPAHRRGHSAAPRGRIPGRPRPDGRHAPGGRGSGACAPSPAARAAVDMRVAGHDLGVGDGMTSARLHRHPLPVCRIALDRRLDRHPVVRQVPPCDARVHPLHAPLLDRAGQAPVRLIGLRDQQQPRGVAVKPMHDPGTAGLRTPARARCRGSSTRSRASRPSAPGPDAPRGRPACRARPGARPRTQT